jgi:hypothetical protein
MKRLNGGAKIMLLNGAPELNEKYEQYLLGPDDEIKEYVAKRKSSNVSAKKVDSAKKSNRKVTG